MSAREWLRRRLAAYAYPEIGRLDQALADEQRRAYRAEYHAAEQEVRATRAEADLEEMTRSRDAWRWRARSAARTVVDEAAERARHDRVERTGGR